MNAKGLDDVALAMVFLTLERYTGWCALAPWSGPPRGASTLPPTLWTR